MAPGARRTVPTHLEAPRTNLRMRSGRWVNLYDPAALDIVLEDWVVGVSRVPRWGGQTGGEIAFNVCCHHLLVERILLAMVWPKAPREARLWALGHDLHEGGGLGDIATPYGRLFADAGLKEIKARLDRAIRLAMGLAAEVPAEHYKAIKRADTIAAVSEAVQLMAWPEPEARRAVGGGYKGRLWSEPIAVLDEAAARAAWWRRYRLLGGPVGGESGPNNPERAD